MKNKIKHLIAKLLFGEPMVMAVYKDKHGNVFGGTIHKIDDKSYINSVQHIEEPVYVGETFIYL
jgi:hypothetical protein